MCAFNEDISYTLMVNGIYFEDDLQITTQGSEMVVGSEICSNGVCSIALAAEMGISRYQVIIRAKNMFGTTPGFIIENNGKLCLNIIH